MKYKKKLQILQGRIKHWEELKSRLNAQSFSHYAGNKPGGIK